MYSQEKRRKRNTFFTMSVETDRKGNIGAF